MRYWNLSIVWVLALLLFTSCTPTNQNSSNTNNTGTSSPNLEPVGEKREPASAADNTPDPTAEQPTSPASSTADVLSVSVSGNSGAYLFAVEVSSPDQGCEQYADWWEVLDENGSLLYRRVLLHSHTNEQPFMRSGGPVPVTDDQVVIIRAHFHPDGYGGVALKGSVHQGFQPVELARGFAVELEEEQPLPESCAF